MVQTCVCFLRKFCFIIEQAERDKEEAERQLLEEMSEDEYDALSEGEKAEVDRKRLLIKKERLKK